MGLFLNSILSGKHPRFYSEYNSKILTKEEVNKSTYKLASTLKQHCGLNAKDIVVSVLLPGCNWSKIESAIFINNCIHAPLMFRNSMDELTSQILFYNPKIIITDSDTIRDSLKQKLRNIEWVCSISDLEAINTPHTNFYGEINSELTGVILTTSGTTSTPKRVFLTLENMDVSFVEFSNSGIFKNTTTYLELLPYSFSGGRKVNYSAQLNNLNICYRDKTKTIIDNLKLSGAEITACVPFMLIEILNYFDQFGNDTNLQKIICGGAILLDDIILRLMQYNVVVYNVYGLTETTSLCSFNTDKFSKLGSVGKICPSIDYQINNEGELMLSGGSLAKGYVVCANPLMIKNIEGYFNTKDVVSIDDEGYLFILGRTEHLIKNLKGEFVNIYEIIERLELLINTEIFAIKSFSDKVFIYVKSHVTSLDNHEVKLLLASFHLSFSNAYMIFINNIDEIPKENPLYLKCNYVKI